MYHIYMRYKTNYFQRKGDSGDFQATNPKKQGAEGGLSLPTVQWPIYSGTIGERPFHQVRGKYGNPQGLSWWDHPTLRGAKDWHLKQLKEINEQEDGDEEVEEDYGGEEVARGEVEHLVKSQAGQLNRATEKKDQLRESEDKIKILGGLEGSGRGGGEEQRTGLEPPLDRRVASSR